MSASLMLILKKHGDRKEAATGWKGGGHVSDFLTHFQLRGLPKSGREPVYVANFLLMHCEATTAPPRELNHY